MEGIRKLRGVPTFEVCPKKGGEWRTLEENIGRELLGIVQFEGRSEFDGEKGERPST